MMKHKKPLALFVGSLFLIPSAWAVEFTPRLALEGQSYSGDVSGGIGLFLPLYTSSQATFLDVQQNTVRHGGRQTSVGLGHRFVGSHDVVYGANLYGDFGQSGGHNRFSRLSLGLEALGPVFEARANVYLPTGTKERLVAQSMNTKVGSDDYLYLQHHQTVEKIRRGADAEVGGRLPVFAADGPQQLKAFAGGYWFNGDQRSDLVGAKVRLEWSTQQAAFLPKNVALSLGAMASYDNQQHLKGGALARLSLSLGQQASGNSVEARLLQRVERERQSRTEEKHSLYAERAADGSGKVWGKVVMLRPEAAATRASASFNERLTAAGKDALVLVTGDVKLDQTLSLGPDQHLYGGQSVAVVGSETGTKAEHRFAEQAGRLVGLNQAQDVLQMHSGSSVNQLAIEGGRSGIQARNANGIRIDQVQVKNSALNGVQLNQVTQAQLQGLTVAQTGHDGVAVDQGSQITIERADISQTGHDGIRLVGVNDVKIDQANIHDLSICDNNTDCEFAVAADPNRVPFSAISSWGGSNLSISNSQITDTTYGVFVGSVFEENNYGYDIVTQAKNIKLDNVAINNTRREGVLLVGANQVELNKVSIDNGARQGQEKPEMDLVVLQATSDVKIKDMALKGGVNGLMLVASSNIEGETARVSVDGLTTTGTSRAGVFFNPVHDIELKNVTIDQAGTYGLFMFASDWSGAVENVRFDNVQVNAAKDAGIYAVGPLNNISGDVTIAQTDKVCETAPWGGANLSQDAGQTWSVNGATMSTEGFKQQCR
ncbi:MAG: right-handed parallel beta-helix repeat-containing protein [Neisseriaceae bacterium]|nr:right-handed parallel beta-helix repeat-containing protein [Neisseriaceae bacterium]